MKQLKLDALYRLMSDIIGGSLHVVSSFSGKAKNNVGDDLNASFMKLTDGCIID